MTKFSPAEKQFSSGKNTLDILLKATTASANTTKMIYWLKKNTKTVCRIAQCMWSLENASADTEKFAQTMLFVTDMEW